MALLKSVDNVPGIQYYEYRDHAFFNKYKYRAKFTLEGVRFLYKVDTKHDLEKKLNQPDRDWSSIPKMHKDSVKANIDDLIAFVDWRKANTGKKKDCTVRAEGSSVSIFSNDLTLLQTVPAISQKITVEYTEAITSEFAGTKYFAKEPKHKFRVYFKSKRASEKLAEEMKAFFDKQPTLTPSSSLTKWMNSRNNNYWRSAWLSSSYSFDYDDESMLSYMMLMHGEILGKRYKLEKHPDL